MVYAIVQTVIDLNYLVCFSISSRLISGEAV